MLPRGLRSDSETIATKRKRQIDTLKIFNDQVREIQEDLEYQVEFESGGKNMAILVTLPVEFPLEKPILNIRPKVIHAWVNEQSEIVKAPGLLNFTVHSELGRVVQAIIQDYKRHPPPLASEVAASGQSSSMKSSLVNGVVSPSYGGVSPTYGLPSYDASHSNYLDNRINTPQYPLLRTQSVAFPELSKLTIDELNNLNDNEDRLKSFLDEFPVIQKAYKSLEDLMTQNEELAKDNLNKQPKLDKLRRLVGDKQKRLKTQKSSYERASEHYTTLSDKYSPESIKESLRLAALHCDEDSEKIAEKFLNRELNVDTFLEKYIERRVLCYSRKTKEEKLSGQLKELHRAGY